MKNLNLSSIILLLFLSVSVFAQDKLPSKKIKIKGTVIEKVSKQPLEYSTITLTDTKNPKAISGGITNAKGEFDVEVKPGIYTIKNPIGIS